MSSRLPADASLEEHHARVEELEAEAQSTKARLAEAARRLQGAEDERERLERECAELDRNSGARLWRGGGKWVVVGFCALSTLIGAVSYGASRPGDAETWPCVGSVVRSTASRPSVGAECNFRVTPREGLCHVRLECLDWIHTGSHPCQVDVQRRTGGEGEVYWDNKLVIEGESESGTLMRFRESERVVEVRSEDVDAMFMVHTCRPLGGSFARAFGVAEGRGLGQEGRGL